MLRFVRLQRGTGRHRAQFPRGRIHKPSGEGLAVRFGVLTNMSEQVGWKGDGEFLDSHLKHIPRYDQQVKPFEVREYGVRRRPASSISSALRSLCVG